MPSYSRSMFSESPRFSLGEIIGWGLVTAIACILCFTIGLPLYLALLYSAWLRNKYFAIFYSFIIAKTKYLSNLTSYRSKLFDYIKEAESKRSSSDPLRILEIGGGPGLNFEFYPENHLLTMVDMNPEFGSHLQSALKKHPNIKLEKIVIAYAEDMSEIPDNEYDIVVATYFLCSVKDVDAVLKEIYRVLKKGGKYVFYDHVVIRQEHFWGYIIQKAMNPMWKIYFNGCNINRDILKNVTNSQFSDISYKVYYPLSMPMLIRPHLMAVCTK